MEDTHSSLILSLTDIRDTEDRILTEARNTIKENGGVDSFVNDKISRLFGIVSVYRNAFERFDVSTKDAFDNVIKKNFRHRGVQETVEEISDLEREWDILLQDIDKQLLEGKGNNSSLSIGDTGPLSVELQDARTGNSKEFTALRSKILVISFGIQEGAQKWLLDTKCPYPMLLDPDRKVYSMFGLGRSVSKVWGISAMLYYAERSTQGIPMLKGDPRDDTQQMGGDFILDRHGKVRFLYCSKQSWDRPSIDMLLMELRKTEKREEETK